MKAIVQTPLHEMRQKEIDAEAKDQNLNNATEETKVLKNRVEMVEGVLEQIIIGGL